MATLCTCRPLDVGDQRHARHLVCLLSLLILHCFAHVFMVATLAHGPVCISRRYSRLLADVFMVFNMHELAITSGFAAAYRLGAGFPHLGDETCVRLFRLYLCLSHAARLVSPCLMFIDQLFPHITVLFRGKVIGRVQELNHNSHSFSRSPAGQYCTADHVPNCNDTL